MTHSAYWYLCVSGDSGLRLSVCLPVCPGFSGREGAAGGNDQRADNRGFDSFEPHADQPTLLRRHGVSELAGGLPVLERLALDATRVDRADHDFEHGLLTWRVGIRLMFRFVILRLRP